jgi:hypothetical protein
LLLKVERADTVVGVGRRSQASLVGAAWQDDVVEDERR